MSDQATPERRIAGKTIVVMPAYNAAATLERVVRNLCRFHSSIRMTPAMKAGIMCHGRCQTRA